MPFAVHRGRRIHYTMEGEGPLVVLQHGLLMDDALMKFARLTAPHLTRWVTAEHEPAVRACFDALGQLDGAGRAVLDLGVPVMIWEGEGEPAHDKRKAFAEASGLRFLSTPGDHLGNGVRPRQGAREGGTGVPGRG